MPLEEGTLGGPFGPFVCDTDLEEDDEDSLDGEGDGDLCVRMVDRSVSGEAEEDYDECDEDYEGEDYDDVCGDDDESLQEDIEACLFGLQGRFLFEKRLHNHRYVGVYRALDRATEDTACVKIVLRHGLSSYHEDHIPIEARILAHLARADPSPWKDHVQEPVGFLTSGSAYVTITKYIEDGPAEHFVAPHPRRVQKYMRQLLGAVDWVNQNNVICRDIKPSNILFDVQREHLTVIDFDLATFRTRSHCTVLGTDGFMAPEVLKHDPDSNTYDARAEPYDHRVDAYSIGVVFGTLLFGVSETEVTRELVEDWTGRTCPSTVDPEAFRLFLGLTSEDPSERPTLSEALQSPFFEVVDTGTATGGNLEIPDDREEDRHTPDGPSIVGPVD